MLVRTAAQPAYSVAEHIRRGTAVEISIGRLVGILSIFRFLGLVTGRHGLAIEADICLLVGLSQIVCFVGHLASPCLGGNAAGGVIVVS